MSLPPLKARFSINVLENGDSEILLLKRSIKAKLGPGLWGFPAGHIEAGESPATCAQRELEEEIGSDFTIRFITSFGPVRDTKFGGVYEIHLYHYRWLEGNVRLNHEHSQYAWVGPFEFMTYDVMDGIEEDIRYLNIWPGMTLSPD